MKRLEEIREEYAKARGFESWEHLNGDCLYDNDLDAIATIYAREVAQASLEKAAENSILKLTFNSVKIATSSTWIMPDGKLVELQKSSITNESNITLL
ncbi:hypothetical protein CMT45_00915 [Elizabethkingia anophelis]|nr:hypothetical protein [Elizabethkingia anophelis]